MTKATLTVISFLCFHRFVHGTDKCYVNNCGCPGNFINTWCTEDNSVVGSSWCQEQEDRCTSQCSGTWCDSEVQTDDYDGSDRCFIHNCGCPGEFINNWCTVDNAVVDSSWCQEQEDRCTDHCSGTWCGGTTGGSSPSAHPIPSPSAHPIPSPSAHPIPSPTAHPVPSPSAHPVPSPTQSPVVRHDGGRTCFSADDKLTLQNGKQIPFVELKVGDKILSANRDGTIDYSKVVFLPHGENFTPTTFIKFITERNKEIKLTKGHLLQLCSGKLLAAKLINLKNHDESCLRTIDGDEQIISIENEIQLNGVYTAVVENEFLVVNGIIASPFSASAVLAHAYYNITDMEDWCSSHNWMVYDHIHSSMNHDQGQHEVQHEKEDVLSSSFMQVIKTSNINISPSQDCMSLLTNMFNQFKDEPIGWGIDGWGYRGWMNPSSKHKSNIKKLNSNKGNHRLLQNEKHIPLPGIITGWA